MTSLLPQFGSVAFTLAAFVIALSIIVAIHEYGHYIVGRWSGIHAEVFSLGFGPVLFSRVDKRGTKWQLAALPFGGYVKFLGDANAASVGGEAGARNTMLGAPLWARAATVAAGPIFNFILSAIIFGAVVLSDGQARDPLTVADLPALPQQLPQNLQPGDEILAIAGLEVESLETFGDVLEALPQQDVLEYRVRRDGSELTVSAPFPYPPRAAAISPSSAAYDIGLKQGDYILSVDDQTIGTFDQLKEIVGASNGKPLLMRVWRDGSEMDFVLTPRRSDLPRAEGGFETRWLIGISGALFFEVETESLGIWPSAKYGVQQVWGVMNNSLSGLWHMITGAISSCNLSGPVGIAEASGAMASQGAQSFIWFVAVLSTAVGLLNLFPIPVLDGGHLVFHAYEAVSGRPPSDKALRVLMAVGLSLILTMMLFAIANDLFLCP